jgi:putative DNA primase/helicase
MNDADLIALGTNAQDENPWPPGFSASAAGIFYTPPGDKEEGDKPKSIRICDPFEVIAKTADDTAENCGLLLRWRDREGNPHDRIISEKLLHMDGGMIAQELAPAGLKIGDGKACHEQLKRLLNLIRPKLVRLCVSRAGWHDTKCGIAFVMPSGEALGPGAGDIVMLHPNKDTIEAMRPAGTLQQWNHNVGRYAVGNHRLAFFICAALTPPLLNVTKEGTTGIHLHGPSQKGKTTALQMGTSVWGLATIRGGFMRTWRTTDNGLETVAAERSGALLPLDELGEAEAKAAGAIVYMLGNQAGKSRMASNGTPRPPLTWKELVFISTGEQTLAVKMGEIGASPMAGQEVRMVNLPSEMGCGLGVFQDLHGFDSGVALSTHLQHATQTYYGTAIREFLDNLIPARVQSHDGVINFIAAERDKFLKDNLPAGADGQVCSVARRMGLYAAAGEMATQFGVLAWPYGEAHRACAAAFQDWLTARGGCGAAEDTQALALVRKFISTHRESRFQEIYASNPMAGTPAELTPAQPAPVPGGMTLPPGVTMAPSTAAAPANALPNEMAEKWKTSNLVGYKRRINNEWVYMISKEAWDTEVCKGIDPRNAAKIIHQKGFLIKGEGDHMAKKHRIPNFNNAIRHYTIKGSILSGD